MVSSTDSPMMLHNKGYLSKVKQSSKNLSNAVRKNENEVNADLRESFECENDPNMEVARFDSKLD
jgi:hypothetical protein